MQWCHISWKTYVPYMSFLCNSDEVESGYEVTGGYKTIPVAHSESWLCWYVYTQWRTKVWDDIDNLLDPTVRVFVCAGMKKWRLETWEAWRVYFGSPMLSYWTSRNQRVLVDFFLQDSWCPVGSHKPGLSHNQIRAVGQINEDKF